VLNFDDHRTAGRDNDHVDFVRLLARADAVHKVG
jgi:hypothetical protein